METFEKLKIKCSQLEKSIRDYQYQIELILRNVPDIVYLLDASGKIRFISNSISHYGYSPEELVGTDILDIIHPNDQKHANFKIKERRTGSRKTDQFNVRMITRKNTAVQFEIKANNIEKHPVLTVTAEGFYMPIDDNPAHFYGTVGIARDITDTIHKHNLLHNDTEKEPQSDQFLPICAHCKKIRNDQGEWERMEEYLNRNYNLKFSHSICHECIDTLYPHYKKKK